MSKLGADTKPSKKTLLVNDILNNLSIQVESDYDELRLALYKLSEKELRLFKYHFNLRFTSLNFTPFGKNFKLSDLRGKLSKQTGKQIEKKVKELRKEWDRDCKS